jgi:hypothetical protein
MFAVTRERANELDTTALRELDTWSLGERREELKKFCATRLGEALDILRVIVKTTPNFPLGEPDAVEPMTNEWLTGCAGIVMRRYHSYEDKITAYEAMMNGIEKALPIIKEQCRPQKPQVRTTTIDWDQHEGLMRRKDRELEEYRDKIQKLQMERCEPRSTTGSPEPEPMQITGPTAVSTPRAARRKSQMRVSPPDQGFVSANTSTNLSTDNSEVTSPRRPSTLRDNDRRLQQPITRMDRNATTDPPQGPTIQLGALDTPSGSLSSSNSVNTGDGPRDPDQALYAAMDAELTRLSDEETRAMEILGEFGLPSV